MVVGGSSFEGSVEVEGVSVSCCVVGMLSSVTSVVVAVVTAVVGVEFEFELRVRERNQVHVVSCQCLCQLDFRLVKYSIPQYVYQNVH